MTDMAPHANRGATSRRVAVPVEQWPARDRAAWEAALCPGDFAVDAGAAAAWRPATRKAAVGEYGRWLAYLARNGLPDPNVGPAEKATATAIRGYITFLEVSRSSVSVASYIGVLSMMLQALEPSLDWAWLWRVQSRLQRRAVPTRNKRLRVVPADYLLALGQDVMGQAETKSAGAPRMAALAFRDGLMIALLALRSLRRSNFLAIEVGRHLVPNGEGYVLHFEGGETKTGRDLDFIFPAVLQPALERYLTVYRRYLLGLRNTRGKSRQDSLPEAGAQLWINQYGAPLGGAVDKMLRRHTTTRFGHHVNIHLFRDCAATTVATEDPEHVRIAAPVLGHANFATTEQHYIIANSRIAMAQYHDRILSIRKAATQKRSRKKRVSGADW